MAMVQRSLVDIARGLENKVPQWKETFLDDADSQDLQNILERFMQLEERRQGVVKSQVAYQQRVAQNDPQTHHRKVSEASKKVMQNYRSDPEYREKILAQKRTRYAKNKP